LEEAENLKSKIVAEEVKYVEISKKIVDSKETKEMILKSLLEMYNSLKVKPHALLTITHLKNTLYRSST
jgi:hypothetical protein